MAATAAAAILLLAAVPAAGGIGLPEGIQLPHTPTLATVLGVEPAEFAAEFYGKKVRASPGAVIMCICAMEAERRGGRGRRQ